jgi:hypothetical protein
MLRVNSRYGDIVAQLDCGARSHFQALVAGHTCCNQLGDIALAQLVVQIGVRERTESLISRSSYFEDIQPNKGDKYLPGVPMLSYNNVAIAKLRLQTFVYLCSPGTFFADMLLFEHSVKWSHAVPGVKISCFPMLVQAIKNGNPICSCRFYQSLHVGNGIRSL